MTLVERVRDSYLIYVAQPLHKRNQMELGIPCSRRDLVEGYEEAIVRQHRRKTKLGAFQRYFNSSK